jgi:NAD dependent epimerase/dehydratase family enzyme
VFAVPEPVLKAVLGDMAVEVVGSHRVVPDRLLAAGFRFRYPDVDAAVHAALTD